MEKIIKLINKWQEEEHPDGIYLPVVTYGDGIFWSDSDCLSSVMDEIHLVSKPCGFIKWLVENDKIDRENVKKKSDFFPIEKVPEYNVYSNYESLLMLLAIQDEPINFLISILK